MFLLTEGWELNGDKLKNNVKKIGCRHRPALNVFESYGL